MRVDFRRDNGRFFWSDCDEEVTHTIYLPTSHWFKSGEYYLYQRSDGSFIRSESCMIDHFWCRFDTNGHLYAKMDMR